MPDGSQTDVSFAPGAERCGRCGARMKPTKTVAGYVIEARCPNRRCEEDHARTVAMCDGLGDFAGDRRYGP